MQRYIPPKQRRSFYFGKKISPGGILVSLILMFSLVSLISAVQASLGQPEKVKTAAEKIRVQKDQIVSGEVVGKIATKKQLEVVKLASVPVILQNLPVERNWPLRGRLTTYFSSYHPAIDIANKYGTPVHPFASGVVLAAGWQGSFGNAVVIVHNNGYVSTYAHMSRIGVVVSQEVNTGTEIGQVGSTGRSTGPHLHFVLTLSGRPVNPLAALP